MMKALLYNGSAFLMIIIIVLCIKYYSSLQNKRRNIIFNIYAKALNNEKRN